MQRDGLRKEIDSSVIVVGAGPAGLAMGACLRRGGIEFEMLERAGEIGASWRRHYDRLHLHTSRGTSALPFLPFPKNYPAYPSRDQVIAYLERYAETFSLRPRFDTEVHRIEHDGDGWAVRTSAGLLRSQHVVVATGINCEPNNPSWPGLAEYEGEVLHSSSYRNGSAWHGKRVLVVGIGNSGGEIAIDLHEHGAYPIISVRSPVNVIPRAILGIPVERVAIATSWIPARVMDRINAPLQRIVVGDLSRYGLGRPSIGPTAQISERGRVPLIDVGTIDLIKEGKIAVRQGIREFRDTNVVFTDGSEESVDAVVLATGYRARLDRFIDLPDDASVDPATRLPALPAPAPGLHFCGFRIASGGMLREIGREARRIGREIAATRS